MRNKWTDQKLPFFPLVLNLLMTMYMKLWFRGKGGHRVVVKCFFCEFQGLAFLFLPPPLPLFFSPHICPVLSLSPSHRCECEVFDVWRFHLWHIITTSGCPYRGHSPIGLYWTSRTQNIQGAWRIMHCDRLRPPPPPHSEGTIMRMDHLKEELRSTCA